ncbi:MAG TPA: S-methyl-5-thioribose-1-phosphate isomerase [Candidatus Methylomirabilis sp.]|nr:S-methyl-5-thioribose-1-phosphate isomerase [Candidatus Methylomirabilis sp.]
MMIRTLEWTDEGMVRLLDQTRLPEEELYVECRDAAAVAEAIRRMQVRGAPAIGIAAAMGLALGARQSRAAAFEPFYADLCRIAGELAATRPTAVNLSWALERMKQVALKHRDLPVPAITAHLEAEARRLWAQDLEANRAIGRYGEPLLAPGSRVLTHCNAGALATVGYGTALGVVRAAHAAGKGIRVLADETRPFLQGARLTAWELHREGIPVTLVTDGMPPALMARGLVDLVLVGADRIARNGDVANKIGTYGLALACRAHGLPFYVAAPLSTLDPTLESGAAIPIEERSPEEVTTLAGRRIAPAGVPALHPAFDVTPAALVTAIITERGVARPPYTESLAALLGGREDR